MHNSTTYTTSARAARRAPWLAAAVATAIGLAVAGASANAQIDEEPAGECEQQVMAAFVSIDLAPLLGPYVDPGPEVGALLRGEVPMGVDCSADPTGPTEESGLPDLTGVPVWPNWPV